MYQVLEQENAIETFVGICGSNFQTPIVDPTYYTDQVKYTIAGRQYTENAD